MDGQTTETKRCVVGIGAVCAQSGSAEMLAYAIGSCIALCLYDKNTGIGAMAHILLPASRKTGHENTNIDVSTKYVDHALYMALKKMYALGAEKSSIEAGIIGGAEMFPHGSKHTIFIGKMNIESITEELQSSGIPLVFCETGGSRSRTVSFRIPGKRLAEQIYVKSPNL